MPTYEQNKKSAQKYLAKLDTITFRMPKESGLKEAIQSHAEGRGESVNAFILRAIAETINRDNHPTTLDGQQTALPEWKNE